MLVLALFACAPGTIALGSPDLADTDTDTDTDTDADTDADTDTDSDADTDADTGDRWPYCETPGPVGLADSYTAGASFTLSGCLGSMRIDCDNDETASLSGTHMPPDVRVDLGDLTNHRQALCTLSGSWTNADGGSEGTGWTFPVVMADR